MSLQLLLGSYGLDVACFLWWIWKQPWISLGVSSSFLFWKYWEEMSTTVVHGLWNLWFGAAVFGTNLWVQLCIVVFFYFCNWYIILTWRVEMPWFEVLKSIDSTCTERERSFIPLQPPLDCFQWRHLPNSSQNYPPDVMSGQTCRSQLFAAEQGLSWQWGWDQPCFFFIPRDESWCSYWYVVVFVVWGLADETVLGSKSCQDGGDGCEACLLYVRRGACSLRQPELRIIFPRCLVTWCLLAFRRPW